MGRAVVALSGFACGVLGSRSLQGNEHRRESEAAPCDRIAAMKRNEAQLHTERARIAEDLEEAHERLAAEVAAQARGPRAMVGFRSVWRGVSVLRMSEEVRERLADAVPARVPGLGFQLRVR